MRRDSMHLTAHIPFFAYLIALIVGAPWIRKADDPKWIFVHLLLLGAVTNLIFIWSTHFTTTLLRRPNSLAEPIYVLRVLLLNAGVIAVVIGRVNRQYETLVAGAVLVVLAVLIHIRAIRQHTSRALPARFYKVVRFYLMASVFLSIGAPIGALLAKEHSEELQHRLLLAHYSANIFGWIGLTVAGTLITLIPTMLRTKLPDFAEVRGYKAFSLLIFAVLSMVVGPLIDWKTLSIIGTAVYLCAWCLLLSPHLIFLTNIKGLTFSILSAIAANIWFLVAIASLTWFYMTDMSWHSIADRAEIDLWILAAGFALQIIFGALAFLVPVVLGGGPKATRESLVINAQFRWTRLIFHNVGVLAMLPSSTSKNIYLGAVFIIVASVLNLITLLQTVAKHLKTPRRELIPV